MTDKHTIPYKIYLEESEMPKEWYNLRADMINKPAPLLNPETLEPMTAEEKELLKERIIAVLGTIYDPEIPVDIYKLGLIYEINIDDDANVNILMTVTAPNCPVADQLPMHVKEKVGTMMGVKKCKVELTFEPAWNPSMMTEEARAELGFDDGFGLGDLMY